MLCSNYVWRESFRTKIIAELIFTFDCLQYISRELISRFCWKTAKPRKFPPAKICGIKVYSKSECRVKDYLDWNCWHFQKTKKSQKHRVLKSNEKLALFLLLTLGQNNQAFMNFIWDNFYQRVSQDAKGIVVRRLIRKTPC